MLTEPVTRVATGPAPAGSVTAGPYRLVSGTPYRVAGAPQVTYSYPSGYTVPYQMPPGAQVVRAPVAQTSLPVSSAAVSTKSEAAPVPAAAPVATLPPLQSAPAMPLPQTVPGPVQVAPAPGTPVMAAAGATPTSVMAAPYQSPVAVSIRSPVSYSLPQQTPQADPGPMLAEMDAAAPGTSHDVQDSSSAQPNFHVPEGGSQAKKQKKKAGKSKKCVCCQ